ncbi:hypothetical protein R80B4_00368 [Fibrobacteres bacterium R8-0-B4]
MSIKPDSAGNQYIDVDLTTEIQKRLQATDAMDEKRKIAYRYIMDNLRGVYPTNDGRKVAITRKSADEITNAAPAIRIQVTPELENIIKAGANPIIKDVQHKIFDKFVYYDVALKIDDDFYTANVNIGITKNGDSVLYQINRFERKASTLTLGVVRNLAPGKGDASISNISDSEPKSKQKNKNHSTAPAKPTLLTSLEGDLL